MRSTVPGIYGAAIRSKPAPDRCLIVSGEFFTRLGDTLKTAEMIDILQLMLAVYDIRLLDSDPHAVGSVAFPPEG